MAQSSNSEKPLRVLIDLNVLADVIRKRSPHYITSSELISKVLLRKLNGVLVGFAPVSICELIKDSADSQQANDIVDWLLANFEIAPLEKVVYIDARNSELINLEDAVVIFSAKHAKCDFIVSRNIENYKKSPVPVITPEELLYKLSAGNY